MYAQRPNFMSLILLCVCSVFTGRYLEKRMKIASIAHSVLFIVMAFFFLFNSGFTLIDTAMINMVGQEAFDEIHEAFVATKVIYGVTMSSLFVMELAVYIILCIVALVALVKGFKKLICKLRVRNIVVTEDILLKEDHPTTNLINNYQGNYLVFAHLRN